MIIPPRPSMMTVPRPSSPMGGAGVASHDQALAAIRQEAERMIAAGPSPVGGSSFADSAQQALELIRREALRLIDWFKAPPMPAPPPMPPAPPAPPAAGTPAYALPGLEEALRRLVPNSPALPPMPKPPAPPAPPAPPKPAPKPEPKPAPKNPGGTYTVRKGDSLSRIAQRVLGDGNRWREIYELNRDQLSNPNHIVPGQVLKMPGGGNKPAPAPAPSRPGKGSPHDRRHDWYISQYRSKYNTHEDVPGYDNGNCGPTSVTMVAKAFGKINPGPAQADAAIEESRRRMGDGMNERAGTSVAGLARATKSYGLDTRVLWNANSGTIAKELAQGRLVIVHGTVIKDDGRTYGGHYIVVTKIENGKAYLNDSAYPSGPRVISASLLDKSIRTRGTYAMVSVGP